MSFLNIHIRDSIQDWVHILSDPDRQEMERMMHVGESVTWPKVRKSHCLVKYIINTFRSAPYD